MPVGAPAPPGTPSERATAGSTAARPSPSYRGGSTSSITGTSPSSASDRRRHRAGEGHRLLQGGLAVGGGADPQADVVGGDRALVAVVGLAGGVPADGRDHVDPADRAPS